MINLKTILIACAGLALLSHLALKEVRNEPISPIPAVTEEPIPTPTSTPEPKLSYIYGKASWYGQEYCGERRCHTASGAVFDENAFTCACSDYFPLGSVLAVSYGENSIEVVCNDRGGFTQNYGRILDLSKKAFEALAPNSKGVIWVRIRKIGGD